MQAPDPIVVTDAMRSVVDRLVERLGAERLVVEPGRESFAAVLCPNLIGSNAGVRVVSVGSSAAMLAHAASTEADEFGFVTPVAQSARPWQRIQGWRVEATMALWKAGWSTVDLDRIQVASHESTIEFAIGNARPTV